MSGLSFQFSSKNLEEETKSTDDNAAFVSVKMLE